MAALRSGSPSIALRDPDPHDRDKFIMSHLGTLDRRIYTQLSDDGLGAVAGPDRVQHAEPGTSRPQFSQLFLLNLWHA
jgi:hypothetical protein